MYDFILQKIIIFTLGWLERTVSIASKALSVIKRMEKNRIRYEKANSNTVDCLDFEHCMKIVLILLGFKTDRNQDYNFKAYDKICRRKNGIVKRGKKKGRVNMNGMYLKFESVFPTFHC